jgi:DNA-directed RNA polymerase subunit RPC12/RpoP
MEQNPLKKCPRCEKHTNAVPQSQFLHEQHWSRPINHKHAHTQVCEYCGWKISTQASVS